VFLDGEIEKLQQQAQGQSPKGFRNDVLLSGNHWLDQLLAIDYTTYMADDILVKVDRASMAVSLEGREPLLDHRIAEFMARVPVEFKIRNGEKKYLLKKIAHQYLPKAMMDRPKKGFAIPVTSWFKQELEVFIHELLDEQTIQRQGLFQSKAIHALISQYHLGIDGAARKIWVLLMFQLWYREWMD
jgi:asparagine synthase (glutamine-hydrolysing)